jgi:hypothetical protein
MEEKEEAEEDCDLEEVRVDERCHFLSSNRLISRLSPAPSTIGQIS